MAKNARNPIMKGRINTYPATFGLFKTCANVSFLLGGV
jgi:hypothetical protein